MNFLMLMLLAQQPLLAQRPTVNCKTFDSLGRLPPLWCQRAAAELLPIEGFRAEPNTRPLPPPTNITTTATIYSWNNGDAGWVTLGGNVPGNVPVCPEVTGNTKAARNTKIVASFFSNEEFQVVMTSVLVVLWFLIRGPIAWGRYREAWWRWRETSHREAARLEAERHERAVLVAGLHSSNAFDCGCGLHNCRVRRMNRELMHGDTAFTFKWMFTRPPESKQ